MLKKNNFYFDAYEFVTMDADCGLRVACEFVSMLYDRAGAGTKRS